MEKTIENNTVIFAKKIIVMHIQHILKEKVVVERHDHILPEDQSSKVK